MSDKRPSWDEYFMLMAQLSSRRSTCLRAQHGAVIVKNRQLLSSGYNGATPGSPHCTDLGKCEREAAGALPGQRYELCRATHSEMNALVHAAKHGVNISGATLYVTGSPCKLCARLLITVGIQEVVYLASQRYHFEDTGLSVLLDAGIVVRQFEFPAS